MTGSSVSGAQARGLPRPGFAGPDRTEKRCRSPRLRQPAAASSWTPGLWLGPAPAGSGRPRRPYKLMPICYDNVFYGWPSARPCQLLLSPVAGRRSCQGHPQLPQRPVSAGV